MAHDIKNEGGYKKPPKAFQFQKGRSGNPQSLRAPRNLISLRVDKANAIETADSAANAIFKNRTSGSNSSFSAIQSELQRNRGLTARIAVPFRHFCCARLVLRRRAAATRN